MKTITKIAAVCLLITVMFTGCTKKGDTGATGAAGTNGNANVQSYFFASTSWTYSSSSDDYYEFFPVPALTASNLNNAAVEVFYSTTALGNNWVALPMTQFASGLPNNYSFNFTISAGSVLVEWKYLGSGGTSNDPSTFYGSTVQIKVVVIPPAMRKPNVNHNSYADVKAAYNLKD